MNGNRVGAGARQRLYASTTDTFDAEQDIDYIAVEYALNGEPVKLTTAEKIHAARILTERGLTLKAISERVRTDTSTIRGWKANGWKPGQHPKSRPAGQKRQPPKCGEPRMYRQHLAKGETPCDACRAANAAADRRYRLTGSRNAA